jgi:predicted ferric reductase
VINWILLRAFGVAAYLMLFASVAWGLVGTTSLFGKKVAKATSVSIHQFLSTVAFLFLMAHVVLLGIDRFVDFDLADLFVPQHTTYRPLAVTLGIVGMYLLSLILLSSWLRKRLPTKLWRRIHHLSVLTFVLALLHGIFTGTDTVRAWMWWTYVGTGAAILFLLLVRGLMVDTRPARATGRGGQDARVTRRTIAVPSAKAQPQARDEGLGPSRGEPVPAGAGPHSFPWDGA